MKYIRSNDFIIHILILWWVLWLTVSYCELDVFLRPSVASLSLFTLFIVSFGLGYMFTSFYYRLSYTTVPVSSCVFDSNTLSKLIIWSIALSCLFVLILSLYFSGAMTTGFVEYFITLRGQELDSNLTGSKYLDILTKFIIFPASYALVVLILSIGINKFKITFLVSVINLLLFAYLWQVNYPLLHLFWFTFFYTMIQFNRKTYSQRGGLFIILSLFAVLTLSAINRFGGDFLGAIQRYFIGYHLIGFTFFDYQFNNPSSILHVHSYGRSSLGFLDQAFDLLSRISGIEYKSASMANVAMNTVAVDVGATDGRVVNAFGTFLFGLYRDFNFVGVLTGGFIYGVVTTSTLYYYGRSWVCRAIFLILSSSWMVGMMVNPIEQSYFWFSIMFIGIIMVLNRKKYWISISR